MAIDGALLPNMNSFFNPKLTLSLSPSQENHSPFAARPCKRLKTESAEPQFLSKYRGVVRMPNGHWGAQIYSKYHRFWLGTFPTEVDAAVAYDRASLKIRNGDCFMNFQWNDNTKSEQLFLSSYSTDLVLKMIKDGSYQTRFEEFLSTKDSEGLSGKRIKTDQGEVPCWMLFRKKLTPSDVSKLNRFVIPKRFATKYFPVLSEDGVGNEDNDADIKFFDNSGKIWKFRFIYWRSSKSYVFTRGWSRFVKENNLVENDTVTFYAQIRKNGEHAFIIDVSRRRPGSVESLVTSSLTLEKEDEAKDEDDNPTPNGFKLFGIIIHEEQSASPTDTLSH